MTAIGKFKNRGKRKFTPPVKKEGDDWILILDNASKAFGPL
jgi:hypothetical protein